MCAIVPYPKLKHVEYKILLKISFSFCMMDLNFMRSFTVLMYLLLFEVGVKVMVQLCKSFIPVQERIRWECKQAAGGGMTVGMLLLAFTGFQYW